MKILDYYWLVYLVYLAIIWGLARWLPARSYPLLRYLHWLTTGLWLLLLAVPVLTLGYWTLKSLSPLCLSVLGSGLLAGVRGRLRRARVPGLAIAQAAVVGLLAPLLLVYRSPAAIPWAVDYTSGDYTVAVTLHTTFMEEYIRYPVITLYRTRLLLFEEQVGHVHGNIPGVYREDLPPDRVTEVAAWWHGVTSFSYEAATHQGVARHDSVDVPFNIY